MDEQAGPGVFFNNNNNAVLPGGVKAPQPGDVGGGEAARAQYSIPGILHFLQHEWARFEVERAQWEVERAELQAQIAFLQGERKGQENLKKDLVRRIKMLEYALKQERAKYHKLKYGTELQQGDMKPPNDGNENEALPEPPNSQLSWKQGRQLLRQYLQEVGYTDTILDVKSQRVKALLGLAGDNGGQSGGEHRLEPMVNGTEPSSKPETSDSATVLEAFKFIESAAAEFSDEDDDEDSEERDKTIIDLMVRKKVSGSPSSSSSDLSDDPDTEEALKGFDFLASSEDMEASPESPSTGDAVDWDKEEHSPMSEAWEVDQGLISKLKEQYRKERKGKKGVKRPNRSKLQDMLANLRDAEDLPSMQPSVAPPLEALTFPPSSGKSFIMGADEALETELGLGELAGLTVANEAESLAYDITNNKDVLRKTWNPKFTLRSHFDSIRGLAFHPVEPVLVTASEDHTLKMWNLQKTAPAKKCAALDVEPIYTFRGHRGAVLCVVMSSTGEQCFSGGVDGTIQSWNTPNPNIDPYDSYEPSVLRGALCGHSDAVWGVAYSSAHHRLLSCSADGTVRLWNAADTSPALAVFNEDKDLGIPSSVDLVCSEPAHMVTAFCNGRSAVYNMETQQQVLELESQDAGEPGTHNAPRHINKVLSHPTLPITITAQEDRHIRFYDNNTGKLIHSMVAHLDAVTSLAVDPNGLYLMSGSHDCSIRLWNMESKTCIQEFTAHRKKFEESIHDVAFHPTKCYIGSAGADALAKVFV
uniref:Striatin n=1 Tax=Electrophorus electricus TaxID=8005 RepID=A0AAY5F565_ELEEL